MGGLVSTVKKGAELYGSVWLGDFLTEVAWMRIAPLQRFTRNTVQIGVGLLGAVLLRRLPIVKNLAGSFAAANIAISLLRNSTLPIPTGWQAAINFGLADYATDGIGAAPQLYGAGGLGDYVTQSQLGYLPSYAR